MAKQFTQILNYQLNILSNSQPGDVNGLHPKRKLVFSCLNFLLSTIDRFNIGSDRNSCVLGLSISEVRPPRRAKSIASLILVALMLECAMVPVAGAPNFDASFMATETDDESVPQFPTRFEKESDKGPVFQYYAQTLTNLTYPSDANDSNNDVHYCQDMGKDLRTLHGITFVEPIARGTTIDDPAVHAYWSRCSKLEPEYDSFSDPTIPHYYWKGPVILYKIDYQNGIAANQEIRLNYFPGSEPLLLFSEKLCARDIKPSAPECIGSIYSVVDPGSCMMFKQQVVGGGEIWIESYKYNLNAVVKYKGLVWLIGVSDDSAHARYLKLAANGPIRPVHICSFSENPLNKGVR